MPKPVKKTKQFIDKKKATTYSVQHRSQRDPLQADEDAPQHILLPVDGNFSEEVQKEEQKKYGIDYDDDYDYMQHLKGIDEFRDDDDVEIVEIGPAREPKPGKRNPLQLPSEVFASEVETDVGLLNLAAPVSGPKLDWDPDIVAGLDDDFDFDDPENELEDDFMSKANADTLSKDGGSEQENTGMNDYIRQNAQPGAMDDYASDDHFEQDSDDEYSDVDSDAVGGSFNEEETKSHFTQYSLTSAVIKRNEGLTTLDEQFENLMRGYQDNDMADMMCEDIGGPLTQNNPLMQQILDEFEAKQKEPSLKDIMKEQIVKHVEQSSDDEKDDDFVPMGCWTKEGTVGLWIYFEYIFKPVQSPKATCWT